MKFYMKSERSVLELSLETIQPHFRNNTLCRAMVGLGKHDQG